MNPPDKIMRELGSLYDFYRELRKYRLRKDKASNTRVKRIVHPRRVHQSSP